MYSIFLSFFFIPGSNMSELQGRRGHEHNRQIHCPFTRKRRGRGPTTSPTLWQHLICLHQIHGPVQYPFLQNYIRLTLINCVCCISSLSLHRMAVDPVIFSLFYVFLNHASVVATTRSNSNAALVLSFLHKILQVLIILRFVYLVIHYYFMWYNIYLHGRTG